MLQIFHDELIQYTSQTVANGINDYYFRLKNHFHDLSNDKLINQICEYTELTIKDINDRDYIINNVLPKILEQDYIKDIKNEDT